MKTVPKLYVKGTFNGWGLDTPFNQINQTQFETDLILSADCHRFKISDMDGTKEWTFAAHPTKAIDVITDQSISLLPTLGIGNDLLFKPKATGRFRLHLDLQNMTAPTLSIKSLFDEQTRGLKRKSFDGAIDSNSQEKPEILTKENMLSANALFSALTIKEDTPFSYVFGDSVDGYYEGKTHSFINAGRYRHHQAWFFGGFASFCNFELNDKTKATQAALQAYGIEHIFAHDAKDLLSIFSGKRMLSLNVKSKKETKLALLPELNIAIDDCLLSIEDNNLIIEIKADRCPEGAPRFIVVSSSEAVSIKENDAQVNSMLPFNWLGDNNLKLYFETIANSPSFTLYFAFEHNKDIAISNAKFAAQYHGDILHKDAIYQYLGKNYLWTNDIEYNRALIWSRLASRSLSNQEFGANIWAGLPWFKDCWGRDTFIALSGTSLVNGDWQNAKNIILDFAAMQMQEPNSINFGRIPNRVSSKTNIIYNTTDGTPWMIREIMEYINYSGDTGFAKEIYPYVKRFIEGAEKYYLDKDGLMLHRSPDTWMDAKINGEIPWSPRGPKANDIQALWFESLQVSYQLAIWNKDNSFAAHCLKLSQKAKQSFLAKFWNNQSLTLADHLKENDKPDNSMRPNQLMTLSIPSIEPLVDKDIAEQIVNTAVSQLLFPWGICSLEQSHEDFHPYHDKRTEYHKDAAYHNGTIWGWNAGFTISALTKFGKQDLAYRLSKNLSRQVLAQGHRGTMSENLDAFQHDESNLVESGTYSQAWSVSEFSRNAQQDYLGFKPVLSKDKIILTPCLPSDWTDCVAQLPFADNALKVKMQKQGEIICFAIETEKQAPEISLQFEISGQNKTFVLTQSLAKKWLIRLNQQTDKFEYIDSHIVVSEQAKARYPSLNKLDFAKPDFTRKHAALSKDNYLMEKRLEEKLAIAID